MKTRVGAPSGDGAGLSVWRIEVAVVLGTFSLFLLHLVRFSAVPDLVGWMLPVAVLLALLVVDFFCGVVHWLADTWGSEDAPWIGPRFLRPFRVHHVDPLAMLRGDFFEVNGNTAFIALPLLLLALALPIGNGPGRFAAVFLVAFCVWGMATNQFHKWAHMSDPPPVVRWLQGRGLILSPQHHQVHHTSPFATHYCITTGWCNGLLAAIRFFPALEWCVSRLTGMIPRGYELAQTAGASPPPAATHREEAGTAHATYRT